MPPASRVSQPFPQRLALAMLLLCMALAQSLSLAHRALHHDVRMLAYAYEEQHAQTHAHGAHCDHGTWSRLFAGHEEGDEACRLIDGSSTVFGLKSPPALIFPALFAHVFIANGVMALAAWQAPLFEARGPPEFSL